MCFRVAVSLDRGMGGLTRRRHDCLRRGGDTGREKAKAENSERELQMRALGGQIGFSSSNAVPLFGVEAGTKGC